MRLNLQSKENRAVLDSISYLIGGAEIIVNMQKIPVKRPFDNEIIEYLNDVSKILLGMEEAKAYPDIVTLGFWMRKSSIWKQKERYRKEDGNIYTGKGVVFHIAPSNVPVNYAYSFVTGLLTGNANIVRIPSKKFPQVDIINHAFIQAMEKFENLRPYICLIRYERSQKVNDLLSLIADIRVVWGGDSTIAELRKSVISPRANEITFADRYSLTIIDSDRYMDINNKERVAKDFYNDTYLTDQNACTSPRMVVWLGNRKREAKREFWRHLHRIVKEKYSFWPVMGIHKLASSYLAAATFEGVKKEKCPDNYIFRINVSEISVDLMEVKDHSGYFFEYDCEDILALRDFCNDVRCQTIGFLGDREQLLPLFGLGIRGIDRVVPIGKTMDFDFIWDGYNLVERLTRTIRFTI